MAISSKNGLMSAPPTTNPKIPSERLAMRAQGVSRFCLICSPVVGPRSLALAFGPCGGGYDPAHVRHDHYGAKVVARLVDKSAHVLTAHVKHSENGGVDPTLVSQDQRVRDGSSVGYVFDHSSLLCQPKIEDGDGHESQPPVVFERPHHLAPRPRAAPRSGGVSRRPVMGRPVAVDETRPNKTVAFCRRIA
jgi:hypothetical protein